jgi:hypothetical protein
VNEASRWTLILGCLLLAILEAPESSLVLVQDLRGPWRAGEDAGAGALALEGETARVDGATTRRFQVPGRGGDPASRAAVPSDWNSALFSEGAVVPVAPEVVFGLDCSPPDRLVRDPLPGRFALVVVR